MPSMIQKTRKTALSGPIPPWAWGFAVACVMIPIVAIGGAIPTALGFGGAAYCLFSAREMKRSPRFRILRCAGITTASWTGYLVMAMVVVSMQGDGGPEKKIAATGQASQSGSSQLSVVSNEPKYDLESDSVRREVYFKATRMVESLDDAEDRLRDARRKGRSTRVPEKQVDHIRGMYESDLEFTMKWYDISRAQLDEVLTEGDRMGWPKR